MDQKRKRGMQVLLVSWAVMFLLGYVTHWIVANVDITIR